MDNDLELVRRGFDPGQVQQLVGQLSSELKTMSAENERLRARVDELEHAPAAASAPANDDILSYWGQQTNDLLAAARTSIANVTEKATADAAAAVAAGETAGAAIRQRATLDAEDIVGDARHQAAGIIADAEAAKANVEAEAQHNLDRTNGELSALQAKLAELRGHRASMSQQLSTAKSQLLSLLALVDEPETAAAAATEPAAAEPEASTPDEQS